MEATDKVFAGSIPELYDRLLVPLIFAPYADDLARRVAALAPRDVLETAAGTGALTRALSRALPAACRLVATDLNPPMLARAAERQGKGRPVDFRPADALALPFEAASFDVVACQFGAMFFPDRPAGFREARRVLRPGGRYLFNVWDTLETNVFSATVTDVLAAVFPDDPPRFMARTPHGYADRARIRSDLAAAGYGDIEIEPIELISRGGSAREVATALCQGTPLCGEIEARDAARLEEATMRAAEALERKFGTGAIEGPIKALVVEAG